MDSTRFSNAFSRSTSDHEANVAGFRRRVKTPLAVPVAGFFVPEACRLRRANFPFSRKLSGFR